MFKQCGVVLFFVLSLRLFGAKGLDLPSYIPKCSLSDPKFNDCVKDNANKVIPIIAKGDNQLGASVLSPLELKEAPVFAKNLTFTLTNVHTDSLKNARITKASLDFKHGKFVFEASLDRLEVLSENYTINEGKIIDISASGHGKVNSTYVGLSIVYKGNIRTYKKGGEEYLEFVNSTLESNIEHGYYYYENLKSPEQDDVNAYLASNWRKFRGQTQSALSYYLQTIVTQPLIAVLKKVPFNKIFLP